MEFLSQTYVALRGPTGAPQTAADTVGRLSDRLSPSTLLADRRAAVLALKGLARDCKKDVGDLALPGLIDVLYNDAEIDADIGKAVLETLAVLCDTDDEKELGFKHTDYVLANEKVTHTLFALLGSPTFYIRFPTLQYLSTLLQNRRQIIQGYFLKAPAGPSSVISVLEDKREIIRNEGIAMVQSLITQSPDIQKILAFQGAFEKLFNTVQQEGGIEGGAVAQAALTCVDTLLRFNSSNMSYFREIQLAPTLCALLLFPTSIQIQDPAPQEFALQFWDAQKQANTALLIGIMGMLIGSKGGSAQESTTFIRCLVELSLASNAPTPLKTQALRLLPTNLTFPLSDLTLTPYMPVPESNGEEWDRLEPASALDALVELALHGEYNGLDSGKREKNGLDLRSAAVAVFDNFVRKEDIREAIVRGMVPAEGQDAQPTPTPLIQSLVFPPQPPSLASSSTGPDPAIVSQTQFAALLFAHLLRGSPRVKAQARSIMPPSPAALASAAANNTSFFVPADGGPPPAAAEDADEDEQQTLLQILNEHLSLSLLSRARADTSERERREWDRMVVGYLCLLSQWLWEDPQSVREFLDAGGLGVLVEAINQTSEMDNLVPALCAFLLGVCYEFNREPGEITRETIFPIINRLGTDTLIGSMARLREDERFKAVSPEDIVLAYPTQPGLKAEQPNEGEVWFDWAFVEFWKSNYYTIQRGFATDPGQLSSSSSGQNAETAMLVASLRGVISKQSQEIESLQKQLKAVPSVDTSELEALRAQVASLSAELRSSDEKRKDVEKEQEDLLVLLDEVSSKRRRDKARMREGGMEVSEDEGEEGEEEEDDE